MNNPIKHHYVPQCYLKKFSLDEKKDSVRYFDKSSNTCAFKNINEICQIKNFYKLSQSDPYFIETTFFANDNEDKLSRILCHFENIDYCLGRIPYDYAHRCNLSKQIVLQYMRTPLYRDTKANNELNAYYELIEYLFERVCNFEVKVEFKANNKAEYHKTLLLENIDNMISNIAGADWELLYTSSGEFYTSDNPVTIIARKDMPVTYCDAIIFFSEIYYPLNSKLTLHIMARKPVSSKKINIRICEDTELSIINKLIIDNAVQYVFFAYQFN